MKTLGYTIVFACLLALLGLTLAGHALHWGLAAALCIAAGKAALVAIYFMHLKSSSNAVRSAAFAGLIFFAILLTLALCDYSNRSDPAPPPAPVFH